MKTRSQQIYETIGHKYTTCQLGCINRLKYCGCALVCYCCKKHLTDCKNDYCKSCRVKGTHIHENGQRVGTY